MLMLVNALLGPIGLHSKSALGGFLVMVGLIGLAASTGVILAGACGETSDKATEVAVLLFGSNSAIISVILLLVGVRVDGE